MPYTFPFAAGLVPLVDSLNATHAAKDAGTPGTLESELGELPVEEEVGDTDDAPDCESEVDGCDDESPEIELPPAPGTFRDSPTTMILGSDTCGLAASRADRETLLLAARPLMVSPELTWIMVASTSAASIVFVASRLFSAAPGESRLGSFGSRGNAEGLVVIP